jgi:hypothetical protein
MATNPRLPEERDVHPKFRLQPKSRVPWAWLAIIAAAVMLLALIIFLPRSPRTAAPPNAAQVPPQPTGSQIQFTNLKLAPAPTGGAVYLQGALVNTGQTAINGVLVDATFQAANGATLETSRRPVEGLVGGSNATTQLLTEAPIKPNESRPVRIAFDHVPEGWNHALPALSLVSVTAVGQGGGKGLPPIVKKQENTKK